MEPPGRVGPLTTAHRPRVAEILLGTGVFSEGEITVALELFDGALASRGEIRDSRFEMARAVPSL
jgi:hypothetical protein